MGHKVSTPRHDSSRAHAAVATSLAILLAVASASTNTVSASGPSCGCSCFASPPHKSWLPSAHASDAGTTATSTSLRAAPASIAIAATVPPPNSRLGRLRQLSRSSSLQQPPGTKRSQRKGKGGSQRTSDLGYATNAHGSHYAQYTDNNCDEEGEPIWKGFSLKPANAMDEERDDGSPSDAVREESGGILSEEPYAPTVAYRQQGKVTNSKRKRARMLRFIDKRLSRLQLKSYSQSNAQSKSKSSTDRRLIYEERKAAWAAKYTSVHTLRKSFGKNKNRIWGDYDPTSTRKLYHTLLPKALLELRGLRDGLLSNKDEVDTKTRSRRGPQSLSDDDIDSYLQQELKELAPLAYQARLAAKKYARERSRLPGRIGSMLYDGYRSWRRYGKWKSSGMTWEQVWQKYEDQVLREVGELEDVAAEEAAQLLSSRGYIKEDLDDEELTARICLRILERSVVTNEAVDKLFLERLAEKEEESANEMMEERRARRRRQGRQRRRKLQIQADLQAIEKKFDHDIQELLKYSQLITREGEERRGKRKRGAFFWKSDASEASPDTEAGQEMPLSTADTAAAAAFARGGGEGATASESDNLAAAMFSMSDVISAEVEDGDNGQATATAGEKSEKDPSSLRKLAVHEVFALRILANTKQRLTSLQSSPQLDDAAKDDQ